MWCRARDRDALVTLGVRVLANGAIWHAAMRLVRDGRLVRCGRFVGCRRRNLLGVPFGPDRSKALARLVDEDLSLLSGSCHRCVGITSSRINDLNTVAECLGTDLIGFGSPRRSDRRLLLSRGEQNFLSLSPGLVEDSIALNGCLRPFLVRESLCL
jgi:hypothetical protein